MRLFYSAVKPKALAHVLFISIAPYRVALEQYRPTLYSVEPTAPLFEGRKGGHFSANTMCQLFLGVFADCGLVVQPHTPHVAHLSPNLPTKVWVCVCELNLLDTAAYQLPNAI